MLKEGAVPTATEKVARYLYAKLGGPVGGEFAEKMRSATQAVWRKNRSGKI